MNMAESLNFKPQLRGELKRNEPMAKHVSWRPQDSSSEE